MSEPVQIALGFLVSALGLGSLAIWGVVIARLRNGQPILPFEPREQVSWRAIDLYFVIILYVAVQVACAKLLISLQPGLAAKGNDGAMTPDSLAAVLLSNALANTLVVLLSIIYLRLRCGPTLGDLGFLPWRPQRDLFIGLTAFVAALVPVFAIQYVLTRFIPTEHPVQVLLGQDSSPRMFLLCVLSAVIVAPLAEEFLFRVLLQGWMEEVVSSWRQQRISNSPLPISAPFDPSAATIELPLPSDLTTDDEAPNPYESPLTVSAPLESSIESSSQRLMPLPIFISSLLFALVHYGHGPDPIPLFVLALMLGYLYQKTHRIWPSLVVHACLNAWSLAVLWATLHLGLGK